MRKMFWAFLITVVFIIVLPFNSFGNATANDPTPFWEVPPGFEFELEYLTPLLDKRKIDTLSLNVMKETSNSDHFSFYYGFTITRAGGKSFTIEKHLPVRLLALVLFVRCVITYFKDSIHHLLWI